MIPLWLAVLASPSALGAGPQSTSAPVPEELPTRRPIAGLSGFQSVSVIRYAEAPELDHELTCTYVFPARARWQLSIPRQPELGRHVEFRYGQRFFELPQSAERSRAVDARGVDGSDWEAKCELLELRLAAFLWPDGFEWRVDGPQRRASSECGRELVAVLDELGRPSRLSFSGDSRRVEEQIRISAWREQRGRSWPVALEVWQAGQMVWTERVDTIATQVALLDMYFLPPDRRGAPASTRGAPVLHFDAPAQTEARESLAPGFEWKHAQERWSEFAARIDARLSAGWERLPNAAFELGADGNATALIVRLRGDGPPPTFASTSPASQALTTVMEWPPARTDDALQRIGDVTPKEARVVRRLLSPRGDWRAASTAELTVLVERQR